jgi:8-oxo-dGTP diphosphatase
MNAPSKNKSNRDIQKNHIGVYGVINKNDQMLLVLKTRGPYKGKWDLPGGSPHHGEEIKEALRRELKEEVGLSSSIEQFHLFDFASAITEYQDKKVLISFYHIGLIFKVIDFKEDEISPSIYYEDVGGAKWIGLSVDKKFLSPFAFITQKKLNNQMKLS